MADRQELQDLVGRALAEDLGSGDITSEAVVPPDAVARARVVQKQPGVVFGLDLAEAVFRALDPEARFARLGEPVLVVQARTRALLTGERTALNFLGHLSGIATLTARAVEEVRGTGVTILDTRKTTPGLREPEKAAVVAGGGRNHRTGLYDAILIKENHIAAAGGIAAAVERARAAAPDLLLEVEVRDRREVDQALRAGAQRLLLDNFGPDGLRAAVEQVGGRAELEASGGITLQTLRAHAVPGLDFISMGALTHSAPSLDLSMLMEGVTPK
jgi:nicotinate-nucleotide pyrophosphorylase (carboxylating)